MGAGDCAVDSRRVARRAGVGVQPIIQLIMATTLQDPIEGALEHLERGETHAAHLILANELNKNIHDHQLCRLANMIVPCAMVEEAKVELRRLLGQRLVERHLAVGN